MDPDGDIDFILAPAVGSLTTAATGTAQGPSTSTIPGPSTEPSVVESKDRKANAHFILKLLCDSVVLQPYLRELLSAKDARGMTPFMSAVSGRAYPAAITILETAQKIAKAEVPSGEKEEDVFMGLAVFRLRSSLIRGGLYWQCSTVCLATVCTKNSGTASALKGS